MKISKALILFCVIAVNSTVTIASNDLNQIADDIKTYSQCYFLSQTSGKKGLEAAQDRMVFLNALESTYRKKIKHDNDIPGYEELAKVINNQDVALGFAMAEGVYFIGKLPNQYLAGESKMTWQNSGCATILSILRK